MSREIRFRAWDNNKKCLRYDVTLDFDCDFILEQMPDRNGCQDGFVGRMDSTPLMQFTGLKDKNGVEIYEGDIISGIANMSREDRKGVVSFMLGMFMGDGMPLYNIDNVEVIGNIYENEELLK